MNLMALELDGSDMMVIVSLSFYIREIIFETML